MAKYTANNSLSKVLYLASVGVRALTIDALLKDRSHGDI